MDKQDDDDKKTNQNLSVVPFKKKEDTSGSSDDATTDDISPDVILTAAMDKLSTVLLVGFTKENSVYMAFSDGSIATNLLLTETARLALTQSMLGEEF